MAVDELRESTISRPAELRAEKPNDAGTPGDNGQGRRKTLLFASILGIVSLLALLHFGCTPGLMNRPMMPRWTDI